MSRREKYWFCFKLSDCSFSTQYSNNFEMLFDTTPYVGQRLAARRKAALEAPDVPSPIEFRRLAEHAVWEYRPSKLPAWAREIVARREYFRGSAICLPGEEGPEWYMFLFARQDTYQLVLVKLEPMVVAQSAEQVTSENWRRLAEDHVEHRLMCAPMSCIPASSLPEVDISAIRILQGLDRGRRLHSEDRQ